MSNLHSIKDWEASLPQNARFEQVFFNEKREVTKVLGKFLVVSNVDGKHYKSFYKVHWDGFGKCYINKVYRKKGLDIMFK